MKIPQPGSLLDGTSPLTEKYRELAQRLIPPSGPAPTTRGELLLAASFVYTTVCDETSLHLVAGPLQEHVSFITSMLRRAPWRDCNIQHQVQSAWESFVAALQAWEYEWLQGSWQETDALPPSLRASPAMGALEFVMHAVIALVGELDTAACPAQEAGKRK